MEYNQNPRKPQAANQPNQQQYGRENAQGPRQQAQPQQQQGQQQGLGKKPQQGGSNPYNKPAGIKQPQGKDANLPPR